MPTYVRALRLPFISASILPFLFGSLMSPSPLSWGLLVLGVVAVIGAHLGANLINDYADSKSGADWHDKRSYEFFGGSKLIQEGALTERWYLVASLSFFALAAASVIALYALTGEALVLYAAAFILLLSWSYSARPLQLSYHRLGEAVIFVLFGPALVMGGYYLQTGILFDVPSIVLSLPFGFLTTAILYVNEVPDAPDDLKSGKRTWASLFSTAHAHYLYALLMACAFAAIVTAVALDLISAWALASLAALALAAKAISVLKRAPQEKSGFLESSKLTIATQTAVSLVLIGSALL